MIKKMFNLSIITSVLLFLFGLLLILNADGFIKSISIIIGIILLVVGLIPVIDYFRFKNSNMMMILSLVSGIFSIVCGLMFLINDSMLMIIIPIFIGVWMIINGINKIQLAFDIKDNEEKSWIITFIFAVLVIVCGIYFIINPINGAELVTKTLGIIICIYAVLDIIDCILIKIKLKKFAKEVKKSDSVIDVQ